MLVACARALLRRPMDAVRGRRRMRATDDWHPWHQASPLAGVPAWCILFACLMLAGRAECEERRYARVVLDAPDWFRPRTGDYHPRALRNDSLLVAHADALAPHARVPADVPPLLRVASEPAGAGGVLCRYTLSLSRDHLDRDGPLPPRLLFGDCIAGHTCDPTQTLVAEVGGVRVEIAFDPGAAARDRTMAALLNAACLTLTCAAALWLARYAGHGLAARLLSPPPLHGASPAA